MSNPFKDRQHETSAHQPRSNTWKWVLGIVGGVGLLVLLSGGAFVMLAISGMNLVENDLKNELRDTPEVRQHIGEISKFETNFAKSMIVEGDDVFVYNVEGDIGSAEMTIDSVVRDDGAELILSASMRLPNGEVIEINLEDNGQ